MAYIVFVAIFMLICARLYTIASSGSKAETVLSGQYTRRLDIVSRSGFVFDRNGRLLDKIRSGYIVSVNPALTNAEEISDIAEHMAKISSLPVSFVTEKLVSGSPFSFASSEALNEKYATSFERFEQRDDSFLCHILGYTDSDGNGVSGVLGAYGEFLFKKDNAAGNVFLRYEADAHGKTVQNGYFEFCDNGYTRKDGIYLTIDYDIQKIAEDVCADMMDMGAVVISDTFSGELVAVVSKPVFSPGNVADVLNSSRGELLNRAFMGYTPGSVFKTVVAAAALRKDPSLASLEYECKGYIDVGGEIIKCHNTEGHGKLCMKEAFAASCNPYFINLGLVTGIENVLETAEKMGVRNTKNINLLPCSAARLPHKNLHLPALVANTSVGQGELLLSPVHVSAVMSCAATGFYRRPSIVIKTTHAGNEAFYTSEEAEKVLSEKTCDTLKEMLSLCVSEGTGTKAASSKISISGKTATAQSGQMKDKKEVIHSWFAGFFPSESPKYTICVLCDGNGDNKNPSEIFRIIAEGIYSSSLSGQE